MQVSVGGSPQGESRTHADRDRPPETEGLRHRLEKVPATERNRECETEKEGSREFARGTHMHTRAHT